MQNHHTHHATMKTTKPTTTTTTSSAATTTKPTTTLRYFILSLFLSLPLLLLLLLTLSTTTTTTTTTSSATNSAAGIRIRPYYTTYSSYINHQLNKTLNPKLRRVWTTRDWDRKVRVFSAFFSELQSAGFLSNASKSLAIGARVGQEVAAMRKIGVVDSIGIDLVPYPPLVVKGDFHSQPFDDGTFDFEFSNVFDHALYPEKFVGEIERTLRPGGVAVLHVAVSRRSDKYSANDLFSVDPLVRLFRGSELVRVRKVDGFGLDTEVVFRKKQKNEAGRKLVMSRKL